MSILFRKDKYQNQLCLPRGYKFTGIEVMIWRKRWYIYVNGEKVEPKKKLIK